MLSAISLSKIPFELFIWLHAMVIAPTNATAKQPKNTSGETGIARLEMMSATNAAQKGDKFRIAAVIIGCALLKPTLYRVNPQRPAANNIANLPRCRTFESRETKSRRLTGDRVRRGTDKSNAHCVRHMKYGELRRLAARAEKGSCVARSTAVKSEYRLPSR